MSELPKKYIDLSATLIEKGEAIATLGNALQDGKTTIERLIILADIAGLDLDIIIAEQED